MFGDVCKQSENFCFDRFPLIRLKKYRITGVEAADVGIDIKEFEMVEGGEIGYKIGDPKALSAIAYPSFF